MTQFFNFVPPPRAAFTFAPVLDGVQRSADVRWNVFGQRWYVSVYDPDGTRRITAPVVGSADPLAVASAAWDPVRGRVVVGTASPHGVKVGTVALFRLTGASPDGFNVAARMTALDATTLAFSQRSSPGGTVATVTGVLDAAVDLLAGMFASTLVYRESAARFEVAP